MKMDPCNIFYSPFSTDFDLEKKTMTVLFFLLFCRGRVASEGAHWPLPLGAVHLMFPPNAVSEPTSVEVHRWKYSVRSPPLQEHEAITSNVIELSSMDGQHLKFNTKVKLSLSHSATDLRGYELVIKRLIDEETNKWQDVDGTRDIRCLQGIQIPFIYIALRSNNV